MGTEMRPRPTRLLGAGTILVLAAALLVFSGSAAGRPGAEHRAQAVTITVDTLPIANALPAGPRHPEGVLRAAGDRDQEDRLAERQRHRARAVESLRRYRLRRLRAGDDRPYAGIPITVVAASENEGISEADNWQNILVKGSSSIRTPADLAGKTIAVNALKGVGEVAIKAALEKSGVDPNSIKLLAMPFPTMRTALANGQVDAIWTPEPFMSQALNIDGARIVMAPGPVLGKYFPNGGYVALHEWTTKNPGLFQKFRTAMNQSLVYAASHPDEIRALLPAATQNIRLAFWSPLIDRASCSSSRCTRRSTA